MSGDPDRPAVVADTVSKAFRLPHEQVSTLKERALHPLRRSTYERFEALKDVSFEVARGEFFGIVGRNGSGKSTLLKLLASIYRADRGSIRLRGRLAPFLELGVGFNPELTAYDNVVVNGVMMGLRPAQAKARFEEVVDFAGLRDHTDLKLKNYSSGMKVRLGFSVMTHVDADLLLIDEVLAVGDAEFQEKCGEVFRRMHAEGRTMVLVTHNMAAVSTYCERAMLLHDGRIEALGQPDDVTDLYLKLNMDAFAQSASSRSQFLGRTAAAIARPATRVVDLRVVNSTGRTPESFLPRERIELRAALEVDQEIPDPRLYLSI